MMWAKPVGWPDLHGFEVDLRGEEEEREEHDERTPTRYKSGFSRGPGSTHPIESPREKD